MSQFIVFIISLTFICVSILADSPCGDWTSYKDEKCFNVIRDRLAPFSGAAQVCQKEGSNIGIIRSAEEQDLVVANLKNQSIVDNVWIGIKKSGKTFVSLDGNALKYTNWANGRPLNQTDVDCVEISVDDQNKWWDVKCERKNAVLCEKSQQWSNSKIENVLTQIRKKYSERMDSLEANLIENSNEIKQLKLNQTSSTNLIEIQRNVIDQSRKELDQLKQNQTSSLNLIATERKELDDLKEKQTSSLNLIEVNFKKQLATQRDEFIQNQTSSLNLIETQRKELDNLKQNPVPIGFIYVQLSGQSEPHTLWPQTKWSDISTKYAGLFFRAQGGSSSSFGETQSEQMPRLKFEHGFCKDYPDHCDGVDHFTKLKVISVTNEFNKQLYFTGSGGDANSWTGINFKYTTEEIRPRNQAIRIWIRIK